MSAGCPHPHPKKEKKKKWIGNNNNNLHSLLWPSTEAVPPHGTAFNGGDWYQWLGMFLGMLVTVLWGDVELLLKGPGSTMKDDSQGRSQGSFTPLISSRTELDFVFTNEANVCALHSLIQWCLCAVFAYTCWFVRIYTLSEVVIRINQSYATWRAIESKMCD